VKNPELAATQACVFDAYGTLFDVASAAKRCHDALGGKADALAASWRSKQLEYTWLRSLMDRHADFWQVTGDALDWSMATLEISDAALRARLMELYLVLDAYPDAKDVLTSLKRAKRPAAILSNGSPRMLDAAIKSAAIGDLLGGGAISVEDAGIFKPHPSVYALTTKRLALPAERICFVSSNGWDAAGAAVFGFKAVWANRAGQVMEKLPAVPLATIKSLAELPGLLGL
jgi:2-haloacid dehalogenase